VPEIIGTVQCMRVSADAAFVTIEEVGTGDTETFILWFLPGTSGGIPSSLTSFTRIMHSMWLSLLREARSNNLTVTVVHPTGSAEVTALQLN
jgi:hypothetical protein